MRLINEDNSTGWVCCQQRVHKALQRLDALLLQLPSRRFHKARGGHGGQGLHCSLRSGSGCLLLRLCCSGSGSGSVQGGLGGSLLLQALGVDSLQLAAPGRHGGLAGAQGSGIRARDGALRQRIVQGGQQRQPPQRLCSLLAGVLALRVQALRQGSLELCALMVLGLGGGPLPRALRSGLQGVKLLLQLHVGARAQAQLRKDTRNEARHNGLASARIALQAKIQWNVSGRAPLPAPHARH